ncbi:MAG: insulinase family protein [Armatimonadetes bacterium]|nr:insulinase family protein [Armatimonadota bacterium]
MKRTIRGLFAAALMVATLTSAIAQTSGGASLDLDATLPFDPAVRRGTLPNGLQYFIRANKKPENRAELRLALNVGSTSEDDDQQGLAHFVEHMAFNGTKNFAKNDIVGFLESIGMRFGADLNAHTSFDETVYQLQLPTEDMKIVDKGIQILEDWAHNISMEDVEIDKERGVIIEEMRLRLGAEFRMSQKQYPIMYYGSRFPERWPIGKKEILETFKHDVIKRFYRDWYRPDLMAVVVVGDFDPAKVEEMVVRHFSKIKPAATPRTREWFPMPDHKQTLFAIATDPEGTRSSVSVMYKHDYKPDLTVRDYRQGIVDAIYNQMLNQRLYEISQEPNAPFLGAFSSKGSFNRAKEMYRLSAGVKNGGIEQGLEAILTEAKRVEKFGFTPTELERVKKDMLRSFEQAYAERDKIESGQYAEEYVNYFTSLVPAPGIDYEFALYQKYVNSITLDEVNRLAAELIRDDNRVFTVTAPQKEGVAVPDSTGLLAIVKKVEAKEVMQYVDQVSDQPLLATKPTAGKVVETKTTPELNVTEWKLSNGIRVVMKPTDFKNDEVSFTAFSHGGTSLASDADFIPASTASAVIPMGGVGQFDQIALQKMLTGKAADVSPYINELQEGLNGSASPKDLETMFQLIYLYATQPRMDPKAFETFKASQNASLQNRNARPETAFQDTVTNVLSQYHFRRKPWTEETLEKVDLQKSYDFYRQRFADMGDFTFVFVGNFKPEEIKPMIETYLGGLPSNGGKENWKDLGIRPPTGVINKAVRKGVEQKGQVRIALTGPFEWSRKNRLDMRALMDVLDIRLRESLREDKGGVYSPAAFGSSSHYPVPTYSINILYGCDPKRADELVGATLDVMKQLKANGPSAEDLQKVKEMFLRERETNLKNNRYWLSTLQFYYLNQEDPMQVIRDEQMIKDISPDDVKRAANRYFNMDNRVTVVMYPETM